MQEHKPGLHEEHVEDIDHIAEVIRYHPIGCVSRSLVREGGAEGDAPRVVAVAECHEQEPADVAATWVSSTQVIQ